MSSRKAALTILYETEAKNGYLNLVFANTLKEYSLSPKDTAFVKELVFGVYRNKLLLDYIIRKNSKLRLKKIEPKVLNILRMGVYQILFMDKVPDHAAVSESVSLAKKNSRGKVPGFVNAVLRSVLKNPKINLDELKGDKIKYLSVLYSFPSELAEFFVNTFGETRAEKLLKASNDTPELCVRVNTLKITRDELKEKLRAKGIETKDTPFTDCGLYLSGANEQIRKEFSELFTVQDQSSQLSALSLLPEENDMVLDLCSAPGGKTTHMAELMNNKGKIYAFDLYEKRLLDVEKSAKRLGISIIETDVKDATIFDPDFEEKADKILIDVPCSGLGIIRRKPDIKYKENITDFAEILSVQKSILENAKRYLKKGGRLVYSTCTVNPKENLEMINNFLKENPDFSLDPIESTHITGEIKERAKSGYMEIFPDTDLSDGFFVCRLKKRNE